MDTLFNHRNFTVRGADGVSDLLSQFPHLKERLKRALDISTEMSAAAYWTLLDFDTAWRINADRAAKDATLTEIEVTLLKYFSLEPGMRDAKTRDSYLRTVDRIRSIFRTIDHGLTLGRSQIDIVLIDQSTNARVALEQRKRNERKDLDLERRQGRPVARPWENTQVSPIRLNFGFQTEWKHKTWQMSEGNIELNLQYINGATDDALARTIVHEASHKYAMTKDILYKHQSWAKQTSEEQLKDVIDFGWQKEVSVPNYAKKVRPMMGLVNKEGTNADNADHMTSHERLLENADSYAWTARRLWKRKNEAKKKAA